MCPAQMHSPFAEEHCISHIKAAAMLIPVVARLGGRERGGGNR